MNNTQAVIAKAKNNFRENEQVTNNPVNKDWINRFLNIVEDISDETLHEMWGHILAGEVKRPNSYSLRTLDLLRNVTKEEANLFAKATSFYIEKDFICTEKSVLTLHETLLLGEIGFLNNEELTRRWEVPPHDKLEIILDNKTLFVLVNDTDKLIKCLVSVKKMSRAGIEFFSITERMNRDDFYVTMAKLFKSKGISHVFKHEIISFEGQCKYNRVGVELGIWQ